MTKLVSVNEGLANGPGGWGLSAGPSAQPDRYAEAHQRQFAKMRSLSSSTKSTEPRSRSTSASRPSPRSASTRALLRIWRASRRRM
jgi:hypothetical protein